MNKAKKWILGTTGALLLLLLFYFFKNRPPRYNWMETYQIESKEPYGGFLIAELLRSYFPNNTFSVSKKPLHDFLSLRNSKQAANYIFMGTEFPSDSALVETILDFVANGNSAFIAAGSCPSEILDKLFTDTCNGDYMYYDEASDSIVSLRLYPNNLQSSKGATLSYVFRNIPYKYNWAYFDSTFFCEDLPNQEVLGVMNNGRFNYFHASYEKGDFYLYTTPLVFTNFALKNSDNLDYASGVFSFLKPGDIIWDDYNQHAGNLAFNSELRLSQSPLGYILSQDSLRWAWYLVLALTILYMIFFGKRRQRIIPILEPKKNTSLEYIRTVGQLYYQERNHRVICIHKMKLFQAFLRSKYFINTYEVDDDTIEKIAVKSTVDKEVIRSIFSQYNWIDKNLDISDQMLINFHQQIEKFYKTCK
ncbi:MAG: hypothetical protein IPF81_14060 [Bacteroidetes bacterium]|nr:hypothetical protein [Bacteroidota bacterium]